MSNDFGDNLKATLEGMNIVTKDCFINDLMNEQYINLHKVGYFYYSGFKTSCAELDIEMIKQAWLNKLQESSLITNQLAKVIENSGVTIDQALFILQSLLSSTIQQFASQCSTEQQKIRFPKGNNCYMCKKDCDDLKEKAIKGQQKLQVFHDE